MAYLPAHLQYIHGNQEIHLKEYSDMKYQSNDQYLLYTRHEDLEQASQKNLRAEIPCWTIFQIHHMLSKKMVRPEGFEPPTYWFEASCSIQLS